MKSIYEQVVEAGIEYTNHESDLYVPINEQTKKLVDEYIFKNSVTTFVDQVTGKPSYDIPFAYDPWWKIRVEQFPIIL